ncbi:amphiphysin isoform X6 [Cololabis saira]|uniref:amphiphysin isoform X6 n=1 Tax=Cololabis saira TaxID=129043 RepID=UPI002AD29C32|nr:amphiphysin isoform X6 [Cololabis saira]
MAEIRTGVFAKNVQKRLNRAQEKVLQKLGKADETKDEQFEQAVSNFRRQECEGSRLQREMKNYMSAIKGMQQASINLTQSLHEVYEPDWHGKDDVLSIGKDCDALWEDFHNKLVDSTLLNLDEYLQQFPDLKTRVAKRSRKLIDYDSARHHLETLQASGMKNDRKMMKAEDELKKAQNVFDELNVGLQDELPYLWDCRVEFYISTFKSVTNLETKFHREISLVCRHLYEVMTKLAEQHSDKVFTIQGAPSDSGPLRLARTPSPPEDESPPESPEASSNQMLRPVSPGPPRPKSPMQFKKGPPVPPPPKATPTKEVAEEQIIDLFGGEFLPAPSPSQLNERPGESLLDLDFDAFQPDESVSPIPQTAVPWDIWSASTQAAQPQVADPGFDVDWSADFGAVSADGDADLTAQAPAAPEPSPVVPQGEQEGNQGGGQGWPRDQGLQPGGGTSTCTQDSEPTAAGDENEVKRDSAEAPGGSETQTDCPTEAAEDQDKRSEPLTGAEEHESSPASAVDQSVSLSSVGGIEEETPAPAAEVEDCEASRADEDEPQKDLESLKEDDPTAIVGSPYSEKLELGEEKMAIPSVVIEPASSNEGDDDHDGDIISPTTISDNGVTPESQTMKHISPSGGESGLPTDFVCKVETMHDFEAANSDELELKRGDVVLVVPTASLEDQEAGWLTGIKESEWLTLGVSAHRGLFPENFTQRLE